MKFEIKHKISGKILFECESKSWKLAIELAIERSANLRSANLSSADLRSANLSYANLSSADLSSANLSYANLSSANLRSANLSYANLSSANLSSANLSYANLSSANLRSANLSYANLSSAKNSSLAIAVTRVAPLEGSFTGWKKCNGNVIVKLKIPINAKRSNAFGRKCRAEFAEVVDILSDEKEVFSSHDPNFMYKKGKTVTCDKWDESFENECSGGIHFFMTKEEAEHWIL